MHPPAMAMCVCILFLFPPSWQLPRSSPLCSSFPAADTDSHLSDAMLQQTDRCPLPVCPLLTSRTAHLPHPICVVTGIVSSLEATNGAEEEKPVFPKGAEAKHLEPEDSWQPHRVHRARVKKELCARGSRGSRSPGLCAAHPSLLTGLCLSSAPFSSGCPYGLSTGLRSRKGVTGLSPLPNSLPCDKSD